MDDEKRHVDLGNKPISAMEFIAQLCAQIGLPLEACLMFQSVLVLSGDPTTIIEPEMLERAMNALGKPFGVRVVKDENRARPEAWPEVLG